MLYITNIKNPRQAQCAPGGDSFCDDKQNGLQA